MEPTDVARLAQSILDTHHAYLHREMAPLTNALRGAPVDIRQHWAELAQVLEDHLMKEEVILFPSIQALAGGDQSTAMHVMGPIPQMKVDHANIRRLEAQLRADVPRAGAAGAALTALLDDLAEHARKEDEELFPAALALLPGTPDLEAIDAAAEAQIAQESAARAAPRRPDPSPAKPARRGIGERVLGRLFGKG